MVIHAISGCDSTSAIFGLGKASVNKKIVDGPDTLVLTDILGLSDVSHDDVQTAGLNLLIRL